MGLSSSHTNSNTHTYTQIHTRTLAHLEKFAQSSKYHLYPRWTVHRTKNNSGNKSWFVGRDTLCRVHELHNKVRLMLNTAGQRGECEVSKYVKMRARVSLSVSCVVSVSVAWGAGSILTPARNVFIKKKNDRCWCSHQWSFCFWRSKPFTPKTNMHRKSTSTQKNVVHPHMYSNIYTFTPRETHLGCQTNRKTFVLKSCSWDGASTEKINSAVSLYKAEDTTSPPVLWGENQKVFILSRCWREEDDGRHAERWHCVRMKAELMEESLWEMFVQIKNKDTLD